MTFADKADRIENSTWIAPLLAKCTLAPRLFAGGQVFENQRLTPASVPCLPRFVADLASGLLLEQVVGEKPIGTVSTKKSEEQPIMDGTCTGVEGLQDKETRILARIVDAMLAASDELETATGDAWSRILVESCRRQKSQASQRRMSMAAAC